MTITRRRLLLSSSLAFAALCTPSFAQGTVALKIGVVLPSRSGESFVTASVNDFIGNAARWGSQTAAAQIALDEGFTLQVLQASAPTPEAAKRAAERLITTDHVTALVGGVGDGQAEVLAEIAADAKIPFFNIGSPLDALRGPLASRYMLHIEASDAMYIDTLAAIAVENEWKTWAVLVEDSPRGEDLLLDAEEAAQKFGAKIAGVVKARPGIPVYYNEVDAIAALEADVVLLLTGVLDQFPLLVHLEEASAERPVLSLPDPLTQTRDFIAAARERIPRLNPRLRVSLWDTTDTSAEGQAFNLEIESRNAEPADPSAWAAWAAIKTYAEAVQAAGSTDTEAVLAQLVAPSTQFELMKGAPLSFRPWDRQLRQPLARVAVEQESKWQLLNLQSRIGIAAQTGQIPEDLSVESLDRFGRSSPL